jgi:hypothetical protein
VPGGLPSVEQAFVADASGYIAGVAKMIKANEGLVADIAKVKREIAGLGTAMAALPDKHIKIDVDTSAAMGKVAALRAALDGLGDKTVHVGGGNGEMVQHLKDISTYMDMATDSMGRMETHLGVISRNVADSADGMRAQTQTLRDNADAHDAAAEATTRFVRATRDAAGTVGRGSRSGYNLTENLTPFADLYGGSLRGGMPGGGGGGGWGAAALAAAAAGGGGGGGGGGGALAGAAAGGLASKIFGGALPTLQAAHMITMLTMETLSTVIPAAVAAGAAGAVGLQAGQNLYLRGNAMYNAQEALGGAYGNQTFGTMLGLSRNLQNAQNLAQGGVFGIGGGLRDLVGQGSGAFTGMGVQTIAMVDRGIAAMVLHNRMQQVTGAMAGGTGFLRTFGDIGANIGDTLLNLAPNLPGIGPGLIGGLKGITGAAAFATGHIPGPLLGAGLAAEAGWRWGGPVLGGGKLPGWLGGAKFGGLAGLAERLGLGTVADAGAGIEGAGLAGVLGAGAGPIGLAAALSAFAMTQLASTMPTGPMRQMAGLQAGIDQSFGAGALHPITKAMYQAAQGAAGVPTAGYAGYVANYFPAMQASSTYARFGPGAGMGPTAAQVYQNALGSFGQQLGDLVTAGPSAIKALQGIGIKGTTLTQAFEAMSMAMISPKDIKGGQLDATAKQQLRQFAQTYRTATIGGQPGTASGLLMAGAADYIMSTTQMKSLAQVNQGLDAMTQIMTGGPAGQAALFGMLGGTPVTHTRAGLRMPAGPAYPAMAKALSNIFTPQGAAAWTTFAGPQGMVAAQQANLDQMRTYLTLGAITGQQGTRLSAFDLQQMLPLTAHSPMAQAMLEQQAMQANIPGISVGMSYKNLVRAITGSAGTPAQAQAILTQGTKAVANIPAIAADLITGGMGGPSALQSGLTAQMAQQALALAAHPLARGGGVNAAGLQGLTSSLAMGGVKPGQMTVAVDAILKNLHVPSGLVAKINAQLNTAQVQSQLGALKGKQVSAKVNVQGAGQLKTLENQIAALKSKNVQAAAHVQGAAAVAALNAEIAALHSKEVTITTRMITIGGMAGVTRGIPVGVRAPGMQTGGLVPGSGSGDIIPAMLEPGEVVVPRNLVSLIAPILAAHRVPGFGAPQSHSTHFAAGGIVPHMIGFPDPTRMSGNLGHLAWTLIDGITSALKQAGAGKIAQALVGKITQELAYARSVSSAAQQGLNLSGMDPAQGSVADQMQSYLGSVKSFTGDIGTLRKQHLNKSLIAQLIAAGPVQGDALAQSILTGGGTSGSGVGQVNSLWAQLGKASNALGAQAAMAQYGGMTAPNLRSAGATTNHVTINVSGGGSGGLNLSAADIKKITEQVQAALLRQARRNNKTGLQASGKGA